MFTIEKLAARIPEISAAAVRARFPIADVVTCVAPGPVAQSAMAPPPPPADPAWRRLAPGERWSGAPGADLNAPREEIGWGIPSNGGGSHWLRASFSIPAGWRGQSVHLTLSWEGRDQSSLEAIVYLDGSALSGLDAFHRTVLLPASAHTGTHELLIRCYTPYPRAFGGLSLLLRDETIFRLGQTMRAMLEAVPTYRESDIARHALLERLNHAYNTLDLRAGWASPQFADSAKTALAVLERVEEELSSDTSTPTIIATGHAHLDVAWLWPLWRTRQKVAHTVANALHLMDRYPNYHFSMSQPQVYAYLKEDDPALYARMQARIAEGRFEPVGMMWLEADCNVTGGESLVRQLTQGARFFAEEFGRTSAIVWLPDVFGYSAALPQLMRGAGIACFMTTKISWNQFNRMPNDTFRWRGIDGSEVLTHFITASSQPPKHLSEAQFYTYNGNMSGGDGCSATCKLEECGNSVVDPGEACDDGKDGDNDDGCTDACKLPACGDSFVQPSLGEQCDLGGNNSNSGACTLMCKNAACGDGLIQQNVEQCDDGPNNGPGKACLGSCKLNVCGDGDKGPGEACDDGNQDNTDSCTNVCKLATCGDGFKQPGEQCDLGVNNSNTGMCTLLCKSPLCGDTFVQPSNMEECDDGNMSNTDMCVQGCKNAKCGDSFVQQGVEQCDDGNQVQTDACTNACKNAACGDGFVQPSNNEQCDDGNLVNTDACVGACKNASCGDGFVQAGVEQCDDGNVINTDACVAGCKTSKCGDGFVQAGVEECDDGNLNNNDGCSATCKAEVCLTFTNTAAEDVVNNDWFDACVAAPGNTVTVRLYDVNNNVVYQQSGQKVGAWTQNQITSTATPDVQYYSPNHNRLVTLGNGDKLFISGKASYQLGCGGSFGDGYGIVIYPSNPDYIYNPKMIVMPYRQYVAPFNNFIRGFSGWTTSHEITWNNGSTMNSCSSVVSFLGKFTVSITP